MTFHVGPFTFVGILADKIMKTPYAVVYNGQRIGEITLHRAKVDLRLTRPVKAPTQEQIDTLLDQVLKAAQDKARSKADGYSK